MHGAHLDAQIPPVFYRTSSSFGAAALLTRKATIDKSFSKARVPQTISCLWATGSKLFELERVGRAEPRVSRAESQDGRAILDLEKIFV